MVSGCVNPECGKEFRLLDGGDLYAYEQPHSATEFFWLCADCAQTLEAYLSPNGNVQVRLRGTGSKALPPSAAGHLRIVARPSRRMPWRHTVPADEYLQDEPSYWLGRREGNRFSRRSSR